MTPDKRLDQIEPIMADVLQKVDRLIEGQGKLVEVATRADQNANTAAKGITNLTITTQKQYEELKAGQELLKAGQDELKASQKELKASQEDLMASQEKLKVGQELILQILREKLP
ncbi:hypothetical protein [Spirosoma arboris]|uniref:hypothetical protein n=1 Tax=Spirosoma arboris TaxID=2682092 RepID=UPI0018DB8178|nr:hypothetical protein [Spirosoma arboris]